MQIQSTFIALFALAGVAFASQQKPQEGSCCPPVPQAKSANSQMLKGVQKATITIFGGYSPNVVKVKLGTPVELTFRRQEKSGCGDAVVFKTLGITKEIAPGRSVVVKFTPKKAGEIPFTCGMNMLKGKVIVE